MAFKPSQITKQNILDAINKIEHENINLIKATRWQVIINNKPYPPKEVMRLAHEQMNGERIWEYGGGEGTNKFLKKFGFKLIDMQEDAIKKIIEEYKIHIQDTQLNDEKYKWKILSQYKGRPNLDATDFLQELKSINYSNLIYAMGKAVIFHLASEKPIELKEMFRNLFDESIGLSQRIKTFNQEALSIYRSLGEKLQHHQDERTIGTYLTFHNPEKYTFYKNSFYKKMCELLNEREAKKNEKYEHYLFLVNRIIEDYIQDDNELIDLVKTYIPDYYDGSNHLLLTQDILYQMLDKRESVNYWLYAPGENAHKWEEFYENGIMGLGWDDLGDLNNYKTKNEIKKKLQELENVDSSKQNDTAANYEFHKVIKEGDIIIVKKGISELLGYGEVISDYFYDETRDSYQKCREVDWKLKGNWKVDFNLPVKTLTDVTKYPTEDKNYNKYYEKLMAIMEGSKTVNHNQEKILNYTAPLNQILYGPPGTGKTYNTVLEAAKIVTGNENITYDEALQVFNDNLNNQIEFITFHQNYSYEDFIQGLRPDTENGSALTFEKKDGVFKRIADRAIKNKYFVPVGTILKEYKVVKSNNQIVELLSDRTGTIRYVPYQLIVDLVDAISDGKIELEDIRNRRNLDLPELINSKVEKYYFGIEGTLYNICEFLLNQNFDTDKKNYVIIIDEINRANISRVFGELITLIEEDKRSHGKIPMRVTLPSGDSFTVPSNLFIIGTMNTADKSISLLDIALRRRFEFNAMYPKYDGLEKPVHHAQILKKINEKIIKLKGPDFQIGHAYFMDNDNLLEIMNKKVIPLLLEYFMNDEKQVKEIVNVEGYSVDEDSWPMIFIKN